MGVEGGRSARFYLTVMVCSCSRGSVPRIPGDAAGKDKDWSIK